MLMWKHAHICINYELASFKELLEKYSGCWWKYMGNMISFCSIGVTETW